jgi:hypothetical protein
VKCVRESSDAETESEGFGQVLPNFGFISDSLAPQQKWRVATNERVFFCETDGEITLHPLEKDIAERIWRGIGQMMTAEDLAGDRILIGSPGEYLLHRLRR